MAIQGYATEAETFRYAEKFQGRLHPDHFRQNDGLIYSSIGLGTYLGDFDEETDRRYEEAVLEALRQGCNVFDCAINYRCMRSEVSLGKALAQAFQEGWKRDEVIVSSKGGFIPFDGQPPADPQAYFRESYVEKGLCSPGEIVAGCHCTSPTYLRDQLERSLENLGLSTIDIYYVHNPETQLAELNREEFMGRLKAVFEFLEQAVSEGKLRAYGTATWNGYRVDPSSRDYLFLAAVCELAGQVGGEGHHFKVIQLPYNLAMPEALTLQNQQDPHEASGMRPVLQLVDQYNLVVMASASICQGRLTRQLPSFVGERLKGLETDAQRAIQFVRSTPGVTSALVGMQSVEHVHENLDSAQRACASREEFLNLFRKE